MVFNQVSKIECKGKIPLCYSPLVIRLLWRLRMITIFLASGSACVIGVATFFMSLVPIRIKILYCSEGWTYSLCNRLGSTYARRLQLWFLLLCESASSASTFGTVIGKSECGHGIKVPVHFRNCNLHQYEMWWPRLIFLWSSTVT